MLNNNGAICYAKNGYFFLAKCVQYLYITVPSGLHVCGSFPGIASLPVRCSALCAAVFSNLALFRKPLFPVACARAHARDRAVDAGASASTGRRDCRPVGLCPQLKWNQNGRRNISLYLTQDGSGAAAGDRKREFCKLVALTV